MRRILLSCATALVAVSLGFSCGSPDTSLFAASGTGTATGTSTAAGTSTGHSTGSTTAGGGSTLTGMGGASPATTGGGSSPAGTGGAAGAGGAGGAACNSLQCRSAQDACAAKGLPLTTVTGTVYDPAGVLPLYNVYAYIPNGQPAAIQPGSPSCVQCSAPASGAPIIGAPSDAVGVFTITQKPGDLYGVPSGDNIPLVLQLGKWRRQVVVPHIEACATTNIPDPATPADKLRLPANGSEGDMPLIAFTSGCDPAECFLRTLGISDSEFVPPGSPMGHVHFYTGQDASAATGASMVTGGNTFADTYAWWSSSANLLQYDLVFNACECNVNDRDLENAGDAYTAMDAYLSGGGRVFATHYYYNWFAPPTGTADLQGVVGWEQPEGAASPYPLNFIDTTFPKGAAFSAWAQFAGLTPTVGEIALADTRYDMNAAMPGTTRWLYNATTSADASYSSILVGFNTPTTAPVAQQCGRAVFSDLHVAGTSNDAVFPNECPSADPGAVHLVNEKALEFLFFDLFSCVQDDTQTPVVPPPAP